VAAQITGVKPALIPIVTGAVPLEAYPVEVAL
jgi:hypothetical protein